VSKINVSIIGGSGYLAAELLRHLLVRDDVNVLRISSKDHIGKNIGEVNRSFWGLSDLILEDISPQECAEGADIIFLAMPHVITAKVAMELFDLDVRIIDLSGDFRLRNLSDYTRYYADVHPCPERLGTFVYGMPELFADQIGQAQHVANPGCFATCIATSMLPLASAGLMKESQVRLVAMTGSSGSGVHPQVYEDYYKEFPLVSVLPKGMAAEVVAIKNSARIEISIDISAQHNDGARTLCVTSVLDNLIKGGAGQAMQNFNLMTGKKNNYQLDRPGMWP